MLFSHFKSGDHLEPLNSHHFDHAGTSLETVSSLKVLQIWPLSFTGVLGEKKKKKKSVEFDDMSHHLKK
jgi:hypothetical protein